MVKRRLSDNGSKGGGTSGIESILMTSKVELCPLGGIGGALVGLGEGMTEVFGDIGSLSSVVSVVVLWVVSVGVWFCSRVSLVAVVGPVVTTFPTYPPVTTVRTTHQSGSATNMVDGAKMFLAQMSPRLVVSGTIQEILMERFQL